MPRLYQGLFWYLPSGESRIRRAATQQFLNDLANSEKRVVSARLYKVSGGSQGCAFGAVFGGVGGSGDDDRQVRAFLAAAYMSEHFQPAGSREIQIDQKKAGATGGRVEIQLADVIEGLFAIFENLKIDLQSMRRKRLLDEEHVRLAVFHQDDGRKKIRLGS